MASGADYRNFETALKTPGVFCFLDAMTGEQTGQFARKVERLGYSSIWFAELFGRCGCGCGRAEARTRDDGGCGEHFG